MENPSAFVLGLLVLIAAGFGLFWPYIRIYPWSLMLFIGLWVNIVAGILLLVGGATNKKGPSGAGFGIGIGAWGLIIVSSFVATTIIPTKIAEEWTNVIMTYILFPSMFTNVLEIMMFLTPTLGLVRIYSLGLMFYLIHLCIGAGCLIMGSTSFGQVVKQGKI